MATETKRFLDYDGLQSFQNKLVDALRDMKFDPQRMFASIEDLCTKSNWRTNVAGDYTCGIVKGLIVTVDKHFWQLEDPDKFRSVIQLNTIGGATAAEIAEGKTATDLGWVIVGSTVDFDVEDHILELMK